MAAHFAGMRGDSGATVVRPLATGEYTWRIEGLSVERLRAYPAGRFLESPLFAVDAAQFFMRLYPSGDGKEESKVRAPWRTQWRTQWRSGLWALEDSGRSGIALRGHPV